MRTIGVIAWLTLREAIRRRLAVVLAVISAGMVALSGWGFYRLSHAATMTSGEKSVALPEAFILFMFMFSFVVALSASAMASLAVSGEIDSGVLAAMIARPVRRGEVLAGKWLGLAVVLACYTALVTGLQAAVVGLVSGYLPPDPAAAGAAELTEGIALMTLVLLLSTRLPALTAGVTGVALFGATWLVGVAGTLGIAFKVRSLHIAAVVSQYLLPTDGLWHGAIYYLEPPSFITQQLSDPETAGGGPFFSPGPPTWQYLCFTVIWIALVGVLGIVSLQRREL